MLDRFSAHGGRTKSLLGYNAAAIRVEELVHNDVFIVMSAGSFVDFN